MEEISQSVSPWPLPIRIVVLALLTLYLAIVVLAPLTIPSGSPFLTTPIAQKVSPVHQALYLNHGYRFFAPDPGPSHVLVYEIEAADGVKTKGHFPDRENTSPRLLYHRWFMLSESMYREFSPLSLKPQIEEVLKEYDERIAELNRDGKTEESRALAAQKKSDLAELAAEEARFGGLMLNLARNLVTRFGEPDSGSPKSIRMWIRRRIQPTVEQSRAGIKLTDQQLTVEAEVAYFTAEQLSVPEKDTDARDASESELETVSPVGAGDE